MSEMRDVRDVIIVGGGITGLAAAYYLQQEAEAAGRPLTYTLLEGEQRLGGKIATAHMEGFTMEGGPDCVVSQKPWAAELARQVGLGDQLMGTNEDHRKTYVLNHGRLTPLPDGVMLIVPTRITPFVTSTLISWPGKIRMGMDLLIPRRKDSADESVGDFVRRRLGREALDKIAEPLMGGIHVSDPEMQSLLSTFPRFRELEVGYRSLILGMLAQKRAAARARRQHEPNGRGPHTPPHTDSVPQVGGAPAPTTPFITLREGLNALVDAVAARLTGEVITGNRVTGITRSEPGYMAGADGGSEDAPYCVHTADGRVFYGRALVLAAPAYVSGELLASVAPDASRELSRIRYVSTATVSLGYRAADVKHPLNGFGLVIPRGEGRRISACTWSSTKFNFRAPAGGVLLRCFVGGPGRETLVDLSDADMVAMARAEVHQLMGIDAEPVVTRIFRWRKANPQYDVGHLERVANLRRLCAAHPGLFVAGSAYDGVGVPDCIRQGKTAAAAAAQFLHAASAADAQLRVPEATAAR